MPTTDIRKLLDEAVAAKGRDHVATALRGIIESTSPNGAVLTIVANAGIHKIPTAYLRGEVNNASYGDWSVLTEQTLVDELKAILGRLANKLRARPWKRVFLIPTGHPVLALQIKAMVYRVLRLNTVDLYHKAGTYFEIDLDQREIALEARSRSDSQPDNPAGTSSACQ